MSMVFIYKVLKIVRNFFGLAKVWCGRSVNCEGQDILHCLDLPKPTWKITAIWL